MDYNSNKITSQALGQGEECPALDHLIELLSIKNAATEAHVASCAHCTTELALFREFEQPAVRTDEKADVEAIVARLRQNSPVPKASWWKSMWTMRWMVPASVAMAAILVGLVLWAPGRNTPAPEVSGGDDAVRSARLEIVSPTGTLWEAPGSLQWVAVKGAARYKVTLDEVDRTAVWSATVESSNAALPPDVLAKVVPRKTFAWQVVALDARGAVIADSGSQRFRMEKRPNE